MITSIWFYVYRWSLSLSLSFICCRWFEWETTNQSTIERASYAMDLPADDYHHQWIDLIGINFHRTNFNVYKIIFHVSSFSWSSLFIDRNWIHSRLDAPKKVKDVVTILEKDPTWLAHKYDEVNQFLFICSTFIVVSFPSNLITKVFDNFSIY